MNVPPFQAGPALGEDCLTHAGACRLADTIREAWARAGHDVQVEVVEVARHRREGTAIYGVRMPGLVNGKPHAA